MNVIAGILIAVFNESWITVIITSLVWGIIFCSYLYIKKNEALFNNISNIGAVKAFKIEYYTSAFTTLVIALILYLIIGFFK